VILSENIAVHGLSDDDTDTLNHLLGKLNRKRPRNVLRASYYDGKRALEQLTKVVPPHYYQLGIVLGWSAKAVDTLARRCNFETFVWPDGDLDALGGPAVQDENYLRTEVASASVSALLHGVAFLVNTRGGAGEPTSLIHVKDALSATGDWNARRRRLDNLLSVTDWGGDGRVAELVLYLDGRTVTMRGARGIWSVVDVSEHPWGVPAEPLVYKPRVGRPFGSSRLTRPVLSLQDQATRAVIRMEGHLDVYSFPEFWMLGADESIFKNADGTLKPTWQVMLGRIKGIPDDEEAETPRADVKQFPASDPKPHLAALNAFAKLFARETSLPDTALAITDVSNPTSAESYDASQYELIAEAEGTTADWATPLRRTFLRALAIANGESKVPAAWSSIEAKWRNPRYLARSAEADAGLKQLQAVPWLAETEVGLELLGLSEQQIKRALADRRRQGGSAALRAITQAATEGRPVVTSANANPDADT
jgi:hypothetical protein